MRKYCCDLFDKELNGQLLGRRAWAGFPRREEKEEEFKRTRFESEMQGEQNVQYRQR